MILILNRESREHLSGAVQVNRDAEDNPANNPEP